MIKNVFKDLRFDICSNINIIFIVPKRKRGFELVAFTPKIQKKRSDSRSKRIRGDDGGSGT